MQRRTFCSAVLALPAAMVGQGLTVSQVRTRLVALLAEMDARPIVNVPAGADLVAAVAAVADGSVLCLAPNFVYNGDLAITRPLSLVSSLVTNSRATPAAFVNAPTINGSVTVFASDVVLRGLRVQGVIHEQNLVTTGPRTTIDQCVILGSATGQHRGVLCQTADCVVSRSHIANIYGSEDTQAIAGFDGTKNLLVDDCYLEASGENVLFGGDDPKAETGIPQDIVVRNCYLFKPLAWKGRAGITNKNLFELKNVKRMSFLNNVCENSWPNGQVGFGMLITVRNQNGTAPFSTIEDVLIEGNTFRHMQSGISILGRDYLHPSQVVKRLTIRNNRFEDLASWGPGGWAIQITGGPEEIAFENNVFVGPALGGAIAFEGLPVPGFVVRGCTFQEGEYGIHSPEYALGMPTLEGHAPGYVWEQNTVLRGTADHWYIRYPEGTGVL